MRASTRKGGHQMTKGQGCLQVQVRVGLFMEEFLGMLGRADRGQAQIGRPSTPHLVLTVDHGHPNGGRIEFARGQLLKGTHEKSRIFAVDHTGDTKHRVHGGGGEWSAVTCLSTPRQGRTCARKKDAHPPLAWPRATPSSLRARRVVVVRRRRFGAACGSCARMAAATTWSAAIGWAR